MTTKYKTVDKAPAVSSTEIPAGIDHYEAMVAELREDPEYAEVYIQTALEEIYEPGGVSAFLIALRQVIEARGGIADIAQKSGMNRQHVYRALSKSGNPTISTLIELTRAAGIRLSSSRVIDRVRVQ